MQLMATAPDSIGAATAPLQIREVSHTYKGGVKALAGVALDVPRGTFGLLGPNGAGKTTLMRIVATLQLPTAGRVKFNDIDVVSRPMELRRVLGYLPQQFGVYPGISAERLLDHLAVLKGIGPTKLRREHVYALLQQTNLFESRKRAVATFSGGMRQRFGIAQALLGDPQLIIVDEPTAGLDPTERHRFHELLAEIGEAAVVILSTHILDDVSRLCARAAILFEGQIIVEGELTSLVAALQGRIWHKTVSRAEVERYRQAFDVLSVRYSDHVAILHVLSGGQPDTGFEAVGGDLEDVYLALTAYSRDTAAP